MKVFMSWSGLRSKAVAELVANWAKCVVQATQPWISTSGIDRGAVWWSAINDELTNTSVGVVCLTHENKNKPWILFEAGALAKGLVNSRVCTFLVDLTPADLESPLSQFNHTTPDKEGLWNLARTLNGSVAVPLETTILEQVFDIHWPVFEAEFARVLDIYPQNVVPEVRSSDSIMAELLENSRSISKRLRAVEERGNAGAHASLKSVNVSTSFKQPPKFYGGGESEPIHKSFSEGMDVTLHSYKMGMDRLAIHSLLYSMGYGKKQVKEMFEVLTLFEKDPKNPDGNEGTQA
jgi:hypothetical protein